MERTRIDLRMAWTRACGTAWSGYRFFLPGIACTWFLAEAASRVVPAPRLIVAPSLFLLGSVFYGAGAARASGRSERNVIMLGIERASTLVDLFVLVIAAALSGAALFGAATAVAGTEPSAAHLGAAGLWGALLAFGFLRFWPVLVLTFHYPGSIRWGPSTRGSFWAGPGLGAAWRLASRPGAFLGVSLPLLLLVLLVAGGWVGLRLRARLPDAAVFAVNALVYAGALPVLFCLIDDLTGQLVAGSRTDADVRG